MLHISPRTLQEWGQGRRKPSGPAKALIEIAFRHPEVIREDLTLGVSFFVPCLIPLLAG